MTMNKLYLYILSILTVTLSTACTDELPVEKSPKQYLLDGDYYFVLETDDAPASRMKYDGYTHSEFTTGDRIGVFAPQNVDQSQIPNDVFSARDMTNEPPSGPHQVLVPCSDGEIKKEVPKKEPEYLLYYPYKATASLKMLTDGMTHTVKEDQSDEKSHNESDLLWCHKLMSDTEKEADYVSIYMHHAMATLVVKVAKDSIDAEAGITIPQMPTKTSGVKLRLEGEEMTLDKMAYNVDLTNDRKNIIMYRLPDDTDEDCYVYRAFIPACWTMGSGTDIFTLSLKNKDGLYEETTYKLAQDVNFKPGHYYTFTLRSGQKPFIPDKTDDDSWVLDVYNHNGDKVGLLCREYVYYEPAGLSNYHDKGANISEDHNATFKFTLPTTGNFGRGASYLAATFPASEDIQQQLKLSDFNTESMKLCINSQAWVFYNLKTDGNPDLTCGTVLRFIFDIKTSAGTTGSTPTILPEYMLPNVKAGCDKTFAVWPYPHLTQAPGNAQGMFKVRHGHDLISQIMLNPDDTGVSGSAYDSRENLEFYMHGGKLIWNPNQYIIDDFMMPVEADGSTPLRITNQVAEQYGHIAFNPVTNEAYVSYSPFDDPYGLDEDENEVCSIEEKELDFAGDMYPLRKVGFNHFWIAKSLHSKKDVDGNALECFSTGVSAGAVNYDAYIDPEWGKEDETYLPTEGMKFSRSDKLPSGYIYPSVQEGDDVTDPNNLGCSETKYPEDYDCFTHPESWGNIALLYNLTCIADKKLVPKGSLSEEWRIPTWTDMAIMRRYGGHSFAARWITDEIRTRVATGQYAEDINFALERGWLIGTVAYCANISGLDLRPFGCKIPLANVEGGRGKVSDFGVRPHFFIDSENGNIFESDSHKNGDWFEIFRFSPWDCWESNPLSNYRTGGNVTTSNSNITLLNKANSRVFAPVRLLMSYKNPLGPAADNARMQKIRSMMKVAPIETNESKVVKLNVVKSTARK